MEMVIARRHGAFMPMLTAVRRIDRLLSTVIAMSGFRLDHLNSLWVAGGGLSLMVAAAITRRADPSLTIGYYVATLIFYYGGNALMLGSRLPALLIEKYGEDDAFRGYEMLLALMFLNQGLGLGALTALPGPRLPIEPTVAVTVGVALAAVGFVVKVWSTLLLGVDVYYYKDLFLGRPVSTFVARGPYRVFANPMYGVGQLHAYGYALVSGSLVGLAGAAICHTLIYVFYFGVEKPFVKRVYLGGGASHEATATTGG